VIDSAELARLHRAVQDLRDAGAQRLDPIRLHHLETLLQRLHQAPPDLQAPLLERFNRAFQACQTDGQVQRGPAPTHRAPQAVACAPLQALNRHIQQATQGPIQPDGHPLAAWAAFDQQPGQAPDMKSLAGFREVWAKIAADDQLDRALARKPENAGPLNSHMLVLRALDLMRQLSPDYLRRFMVHVDTLLWLEQVQTTATETKPKTPRRGRPSKTGAR
jgi:Protein of unknown function (DUF2894)